MLPQVSEQKARTIEFRYKKTDKNLPSEITRLRLPQYPDLSIYPNLRVNHLTNDIMMDLSPVTIYRYAYSQNPQTPDFAPPD